MLELIRLETADNSLLLFAAIALLAVWGIREYLLRYKNINMDDVRKTLGNLDESTDPEYLGPAPDGFELIQDSDAPLDEKAVKEQYQRLEKEVLAENQETEKKTSQTTKNSVQRKLSFSLKPKK